MNTLNTTTTLPIIKRPKLMKSPEPNKKWPKKQHRMVMRRLYNQSLKKIKAKENNFFHKTRVDVKLDEKLEDLRRKSRIAKQKSQSFFYQKFDKDSSSDICKLLKLQDSMQQLLFMNTEACTKLPSTTKASSLKKQASINDFESDQERDSLHIENASSSLKDYKSELTLVRTRIKVILTTLPELKDNITHNEIHGIKDPNLIKRFETLMNLLSTYQVCKQKLLNLIKLIERHSHG